VTAYADAMARSNAASILRYGQAVTVVVAGGTELATHAIVSDDFGTDGRVLPFEHASRSFSFLASALQSVEAGHGDTIQLGDDSFRIIDVVYDGGGMAHAAVSAANVGL
jgi:hypothetical protein